MDALKQLLEEEEGRVAHAYPDSKGYLTIGVGHLIDPRLGGRLPEAIIDALLASDMDAVEQEARTLAGYAQASPVRQAVLCSMVFQMGIHAVREFTQLLAALAAGDYAKAAAAGLDSQWARVDSPARARREMDMMSTGIWIPQTAKDGAT